MIRSRWISTAAALALITLNACGGSAKAPSTSESPRVLEGTLVGAGGTTETLSARSSQAPATVLVFFTSECPVQKAHDARVRELVDAYGPRGVAFVGVVSEAGADLSAEAADAERRGLGLTMRSDPGAKIADAVGAEYSTHTVVLDRTGAVRYSGAIDSDRVHLTSSAERYARDAIEATLSGRPVKKAKTEALGCPMRKH